MSPWMTALVPTLALVATASGGCRCGRAPVPGSEAVAEFSGGTITAAELTREANRLAPALRQQFETQAGRRDLLGAILDKRLLVAEARRRELDADPELRRQVAELEERLTIQALLAAEEKQAGAPSEADLRAWYQAHRGDLAQPERVRVVRALASMAPGAPEATRQQARQRVQRLAERLRRGETAAKVAVDGDGPERFRSGDYGLVARGSGKCAALEQASLSLTRVGEVSEVFQCDEGYAVVALVERQAARAPEFEEVRSEVENRMSPQRKRKVFDDLIERLRKGADVKYDSGPGHR